MPPHANHAVSMVEKVEGKKIVSSVDELKTPLSDVKDKFLMNKIFLGCDIACEHFLENLRKLAEF